MNEHSQNPRAAMEHDTTPLTSSSDRLTQLYDLLDCAHSGLFSLDTDWRFTYVNHQTQQILNRNASELLGTQIWDSFPEADNSALSGSLRRAMREKEIAEVEAYVEPGKCWYELRICPIAGGLAVSFNDITDRRNAEQALDERLQFETMFSEISAGLVNSPTEELGDQILKCLARLVDFLNAERGTLYEFSEGQKFLKRLESVRHSNVPSSPLEMIGPNFPWLIERLLSGQILKVTHLPDQLPPEAAAERDLVIAIGMKSSLIVPLFAGGRPLGALALASFHEFREWPDDIVPKVRVAGEILANALTRRRTELAIRHSEAFLRSIVENVWDSVCIVGRDATIIFQNSAIQRILGYKPEEMTAKAYLEFIHPEDRVNAEQQVEAIFQQDEGIYFTGRFRHVDGSWRVLESIGHRIDSNGERPIAVINCRDLTERLALETKLAVQSERLDAFFCTSPAGLGIVDDQLRYVRVNETLALINGAPVEEHIGKTVREVLPSMAPILEPMLQYVLTKGEPLLNFEVSGELPTRPGVQHISASYFPLKDQDGRIIAVGAQILDQTEYVNAMEELRSSEERLRLLLEEVPAVIWTTDTELKILSWVGARLVNETNSAMEGATLSQLFQTSDPDYPPISAHLRALTGESVTYEVEWDGRIFEAFVEPRRNTDDEISGCIGVALDITERKAAAAALRNSQEQLAQSQKMEAIGQLAGGVAHDFNNLLTVISGYSDLAMRKLEKGNPLRRSIEEISKAANRASTLTRQLLAFSRKQVLQLQVLDLNAVIAGMSGMLSRLIGENIELFTLLEPALWSIKADPGQIEQVILNLAVNARDAMPEGGTITIETRNVPMTKGAAETVGGIEEGDYVLMTISDTGHGIERPIQKRIFEPFFTTKPVSRGTGLGLSTVYGIVNQSGGAIVVDSQPGLGTMFSVYLPRAESQPGVETEGAAEDKADPGSETILLVEDEETVRGLAAEVLEAAGYKVLTAADGDEALSICEAHDGPIHLVLTDIVMPNMSGHVVASRVAELRPDTKVLFMSGYSYDAVTHRGVLNQGVDLIEKPFTADHLVRKVRDVLDRK